MLAVVLVAAGACSSGGGGEQGSGDGASPSPRSAELPPCPLGALDDADAPVEIVVWHSQGAKPGEAIEELAARYNASQDRVQVRLESQGSDYPELVAKYISSVASGSLPDVLLVDDTSTQLLADSDTVLPAQACFEAEGTDLEQFDETARAYYTINEILYPASVGLANVLLYYNRTHFELAGLDPDDPPDTLEEVRVAAEAIAEADITATPLVHEVSSWKTEFWLTGAGAPIVDAGNGRDGDLAMAAALDNEATRTLWSWLADMNADGLLLPIASDPGIIDHYLAMAAERASMMVESTAAATSVEAFLAGDVTVVNLEAGEISPDVSGLAIDAAAFPGVEESGRMQIGGFAWYVMNAGTDAKQAAAWDFMTFINSVESQITLTLAASMLPWREGVIEDDRVTDAWATGLSGRWLRVAADQQRDGLDAAFPGPLIGPYDEVRAAIEDAQERLLLSGQSVDDALSRAEAEITEALEQYALESG